MKPYFFLIWLLLVLMSGLSYLLAERGQLGADASAVIILLLGAMKAQLLVDYFMALKLAPILWRLLLSSYAWLLFLLIGLIQLLST